MLLPPHRVDAMARRVLADPGGVRGDDAVALDDVAFLEHHHPMARRAGSELTRVRTIGSAPFGLHARVGEPEHTMSAFVPQSCAESSAAAGEPLPPH
jgi:hypothetical protein